MTAREPVKRQLRCLPALGLLKFLVLLGLAELASDEQCNSVPGPYGTRSYLNTWRCVMFVTIILVLVMLVAIVGLPAILVTVAAMRSSQITRDLEKPRAPDVVWTASGPVANKRGLQDTNSFRYRKPAQRNKVS